jgi:hypothetical protein
MTKEHIQIEEYPQSVPNLTATTSNLYDLIQARQLVLYPDAQMRLAVSRAIITESSRGWKLFRHRAATSPVARRGGVLWGAPFHATNRHGRDNPPIPIQGCRGRQKKPSQ